MSTPLHRLAALGAVLMIGTAASRPAAPTTPPAATGAPEAAAATAARPSPCCSPSPRPPATRPSTSRCSRRRSRSSAATATSATTTPTRTRPSRAQQVDTAINAGAKVIVLDPVNGAGAGGMVTSAQAVRRQGHRLRPVHRGRRLLHVLRQRDGRQDAGRGARLRDMGDKGNILMLNGAPSDPNAAQFKAGAHSVLDRAT